MVQAVPLTPVPVAQAFPVEGFPVARGVHQTTTMTTTTTSTTTTQQVSSHVQQGQPIVGALVVDTTGDGIRDSLVVDTTGDGRHDTVLPMPTHHAVATGNVNNEPPMGLPLRSS